MCDTCFCLCVIIHVHVHVHIAKMCTSLVSLPAIKPPVQSFSGALKSIFLGHTGGTFGSWRKCEKTLGATNYAASFHWLYTLLILFVILMVKWTLMWFHMGSFHYISAVSTEIQDPNSSIPDPAPQPSQPLRSQQFSLLLVPYHT